MLTRSQRPVLPVRTGSIKPLVQKHTKRLRARQTAAQALLGFQGLDNPRDIDSLAEGVNVTATVASACACMAVSLPMQYVHHASRRRGSLRNTINQPTNWLQVSQAPSTALSTRPMLPTVVVSKQHMPAVHSSSSCKQPAAAWNLSKHATQTAPGKLQHRRHCSSCPAQLSTSGQLLLLLQPIFNW
jgi:hypothetical protein